MSGKMICSVAVALACAAFAAVPALASASPVLKDSSGTVPVGAKIVGTNVGVTKMTTELGTIECQSAVLTGTVTKNNGTEIEGDIESAAFTGTGSGGKCTTKFLGDIGVTTKRLPWCLKAGGKLAKDGFTVASTACPGSGAMEFTLDSSLVGECTYTATLVSGTFTTGPGSVLTISEQPFKQSAGSSFCPESGKLDMAFTLETDNEAHEAVWVE